MKKVFIRSGIRFDYLIYDNDRTFLRELCEHHVSGQVKGCTGTHFRRSFRENGQAGWMSITGL